MLPTRFHVPRRTQDSTRSAPNFDYGACTLFGGPFNVLLLSVTVPHRGPTTPALRLVWALPRSLAATGGISVDFFSSGYLDVSVPPVRLINLWIQLMIV